jgi:hypothetical protein
MWITERIGMLRARRRIRRFADASERVIDFDSGRTEGEELDLIASDRALYVCLRRGWVMMRAPYREIRAASWSLIGGRKGALAVEFQPTESGRRLVTFEIEAPRDLGRFVASRVSASPS